jgi:hypothetical protein
VVCPQLSHVILPELYHRRVFNPGAPLEVATRLASRPWRIGLSSTLLLAAPVSFAPLVITRRAVGESLAHSMSMANGRKWLDTAFEGRKVLITAAYHKP